MNETLLDFLAGSFLPWLPKIFFGLVFLLAVYYYFTSKGLSYKKLIVASLIFYLLFASFLTWGQYFVWSQTEFTRHFIDSPVDEAALKPILKGFYPLFNHNLGYFSLYVLERFWLEILLGIGSAYFFYLILKALTKYREDLFESGEQQLGFLMALIVPWPNIVFFLILTFLAVILVSLYRRAVLKELYTTLGLPFLIAAGVTLLFGDYLVKLFGLTVLKI